MIDIEASIDELREIWGQGPGMHKRQNDLLRYERIIDTLHPKVVVETGLYYGGSQLWFAERVPFVINVELPDSMRDANNQTTADYRMNRHGLGWPPENALLVEGDSSLASTLSVVQTALKEALEEVGDGPVMVVLDSNHDALHVYREMMLYHQLVTPGSYMVVEDGLLHYMPREGERHYQGRDTPNNWFDGCPLCAIEPWLNDHVEEWEADTVIEDLYPTSQHPHGWLRRK